MTIKDTIYALLVTLMPVAQAIAQTAPISTTDSMGTEEAFNAKTDGIFFEAITARRHEDYALAATRIKEFIAVRPDVASAYYEQARIYAEQKDANAAIASIKNAIARDSTNKWYKEYYANMLVARKDFAAAAAVFATLTRQEPADHDYPAKAAECYVQAGQKEEALKYIDIALARNMDDEQLMLEKMQLYLSLKNPAKAIEVVKQLIVLEPRAGKYYKVLGSLYDINDMADKAEELYEQAVKKLPDDASLQIGLAEHYLRKGDTVQYRNYIKKAITNPTIEADAQIDPLELLSTYMSTMPDEAAAYAEALPLAAQILEQDPGNPAILAYYGLALEGSNMKDSAAVMYKRSIAIKPSTYNVWGQLLGLYLEKSSADSLIKYTEKALKLFPNMAVIHFYNGLGHMYKNENPQAIKAINRAIDIQPEDEKEVLNAMYTTLGDIYYTTRQYTLSDEAFVKALELSPDNTNTLNNYSYYLSERGVKLDEAERMSRKSLELQPNEITYLDTYGWILYKKGDFQKALEYINKAIDAAKGHDDATFYDHKGDILYKLKETEQAVDAWKKAKEKGSDNANLDKKISEKKL